MKSIPDRTMQPIVSQRHGGDSIARQPPSSGGRETSFCSTGGGASPFPDGTSMNANGATSSGTAPSHTSICQLASPNVPPSAPSIMFDSGYIAKFSAISLPRIDGGASATTMLIATI